MELPTNPLSEVLALLDAVGRDGMIASTNAGAKVDGFDFCKAILLLVHMQASQMQLSTAIAAKDEDVAIALVNDIAAKMQEVTRISLPYIQRPTASPAPQGEETK